jgi:hypothetical protein
MYKKQIKRADQISGFNASQYPFSPESFVSLFAIEKQRLEYTEI